MQHRSLRPEQREPLRPSPEPRIDLRDRNSNAVNGDPFGGSTELELCRIMVTVFFSIRLPFGSDGS
jgi:hypothetical protein